MTDLQDRKYKYLKKLEHSNYSLWMREAIIAMCHYKRKKACEIVRQAIKRKESFDGEACYFVYKLFYTAEMREPDVPEYVIPGRLKSLEHKNDWEDAALLCHYAPVVHSRSVDIYRSLVNLSRKEGVPPDADDVAYLEEITSEAYYKAHPEVCYPEWCRYLEREDYYKFSVASGILLAAIPLDFLICMKLGLTVNKGNTLIWYIIFFVLSLIGHCCLPFWGYAKVSFSALCLTSLGLIVSEAWGTVRMVYHGCLYLKSPAKQLYLQAVNMWNGFPPNVQKNIGLGVLVILAVIGCVFLVVVPLAMFISGIRKQNK